MRATVTRLRLAGTAPGSDGGRVDASWGVQLVLALVNLWMIVGMYVDGWAHVNLTIPDTFLTPYHAMLYSGGIATAAWLLLQVERNQRRGLRGLAAVPRGYGLGLLGVAGFFVAGGFDALWHAVFGFEVDFETLLSPPHLLLAMTGAFIQTTPLRAAWSSRREPGRDIGFRAFLPALLSLVNITAGTAFFLSYAGAFKDNATTLAGTPWVQGSTTWALHHIGTTSLLVMTLVLLVPVLFAACRWRLPAGAVTVVFTATALLSSGMFAFRTVELVVAAAVGGLVADLLIARLDPRPSRPLALRAFAVVVPWVLWTTYAGVAAAVGELGWPVNLWTGAPFLASVAGLALSYLMAPPALPGALATAPDPEAAATTAPPSPLEAAATRGAAVG